MEIWKDKNLFMNRKLFLPTTYRTLLIKNMIRGHVSYSKNGIKVKRIKSRKRLLPVRLELTTFRL